MCLIMIPHEKRLLCFSLTEMSWSLHQFQSYGKDNIMGMQMEGRRKRELGEKKGDGIENKKASLILINF